MEVGILTFQPVAEFVIRTIPSFQFANSYQLRPGDCPVQRVRISFYDGCTMESLSHIIPFDPSQHASEGVTFEHVDQASGRRFIVECSNLASSGDIGPYRLKKLRFSLP